MMNDSYCCFPLSLGIPLTYLIMYGFRTIYHFNYPDNTVSHGHVSFSISRFRLFRFKKYAYAVYVVDQYQIFGIRDISMFSRISAARTRWSGNL